MTRWTHPFSRLLPAFLVTVTGVVAAARARLPLDEPPDATTWPSVETPDDPAGTGPATTAPAAIEPPPTTAPTTAPAADPAAPPDAYSLAELADRAESTAVILRRVDDELRDDPVTGGVDERVSVLTDEVTARLDESEKMLSPGPSLDTLRTLEREWAEIRRQLSDWAGDLATRSADLKRDDAQLAKLGGRWERTQAAVREAGVDAAVTGRVATILRQIGDARRRIESRAGRVRALQGRVAAQDVRVADALSLVREAQATAVTRLLERDSPPLWSGRLGPEARQDLAEDSRYSFARQWEATWAYARRRTGRFLFHAALVALLASWASRVCRRWGDRLKEDPETARSSAVFRMPVSAAVVATLPLVPWLYPQAPRLFMAILGGATLVPAIDAGTVVPRHVAPSHAPARREVFCNWVIRIASGSRAPSAVDDWGEDCRAGLESTAIRMTQRPCATFLARPRTWSAERLRVSAKYATDVKGKESPLRAPSRPSRTSPSGHQGGDISIHKGRGTRRGARPSRATGFAS